MSRIAIVGSRDFPDLDLVRDFVDSLPPGTVVISGAARGVDTVAATAALVRGLLVEEYPADWKAHGRAAGYLRNRTLVVMADRVVAFHDGSSRGTQHTMDIAKEMGKPVTVYRPRKATPQKPLTPRRGL